MIKCEKGECFINGTGKEVIHDFLCITQGVAETMGEDTAKEVIPAMVNYALNGMGKPNIVEKEISEGAVS